MYTNPEEVFGGQMPLLQLIDTIYAAASDRSGWPGVLKGVADVAGADSCLLFGTSPYDAVPAVLALHEFGPDSWEAFASYYAAINPIMQRCERMLVVGDTWFAEQVISESELEHTEFYTDFLQPNDVHYAAGIRVIPAAGFGVNVALHRSRGRAPFSDATSVILQTLRPHLERALMLHFRMEKDQARSRGLQSALNTMTNGVFGFDSNARVIFMNAQAEELLRSGDALKIVNGRLTTVAAGDRQRLQNVLADPLKAASLQIERCSGGPPLIASMSPFHCGDIPGAYSFAAILTVSDAAGARRSRAGLMKSLFRLTPAECRIADLLLEGKELREIADMQRITLGTARFQLKRVLAKTGARRQSDLVRLMLSLPETP